jgi:hypothetical protein
MDSFFGEGDIVDQDIKLVKTLFYESEKAFNGGDFREIYTEVGACPGQFFGNCPRFGFIPGRNDHTKSLSRQRLCDALSYIVCGPRHKSYLFHFTLLGLSLLQTPKRCNEHRNIMLYARA